MSAHKALATFSSAVLPALAVAQAPVINAVTPLANARSAVRTGPLTVTFSQPLTATSAVALKVFSQQSGGLRTQATTPATVSGNTLSFGPGASPFMPGETVSYTVTRAAASSGGALAQPQVGQFTTSVSGAGTGRLQPGSVVAAGSDTNATALGDLDGDGDLDLLAAEINGAAVNVRFNNGSGVFSGSQSAAVNASHHAVAVGDLDGDGDLDFVVPNYNSSSVSVRFNNGSGAFSGNQDVAGGGFNTTNVALGDVDGDGDLDFVATEGNVIIGVGVVSVRFNDGNGIFSGTQVIPVGYFPSNVALRDVDNDGDLDLLASNRGNSLFPASRSTVSVRLNDGSGTFSGNQDVSVGNEPSDLAVGDVDGDGDLDLLTPNRGSNPGTVSVRFNNGSGTFSGSQDVIVDDYPSNVALGDMDGDGDLDLLTTHFSFNSAPGSVSVRFNDGTGSFSGSQSVAIGGYPGTLALGDVDGDGDLDVALGNLDNTGFGVGTTVSVCLNSLGLATQASQIRESRTLFPNPAVAGALVQVAQVGAGASVEVRDALGRVLCTAKADAEGKAQIALPADFSAGVYLVHSGGQALRLMVE
ncbi:FG-GAP-like repeat-containing protein [Hymenobacter sp. ASUV-10]|uniref:FG-GAP-like repeat-containing protein n=1 Tax=Hymenobacter aranciens TaxID=3063996 RepID=A0ABT9BD98_9BACT|nr:FG-GAP-like repeat-containing protein [Hymenobacter sp. ASUV-10]MDO7876229.1 FG-GAP-like repeat-containing protein [Hymenobacter sp. ASUV-10]